MDPTTIAQRLQKWHLHQQRALPWRHQPAGARDAYSVWVSEIMAQQTRVETVADYYVRWMARFPSIHALAQADQEEILKSWQGLGYYARARNLHRTARLLVAHYGGELPRSRQALLSLPGIGPYTAGAILSLAYGQPEPILDGNLKRLLARLTAERRPISQTAVLHHLWQLAGQVVQAAEPGLAGVVNEGMMELGATLCTPTSPRCLLCPLASLCAARAEGSQAQLPLIPARKASPHYDVAAGVIWQDLPFHSPLLIARRPQESMLGGMWEFPGGKLEAQDPDLASCLRREVREELGIEIEVGRPATTVKHAYTHFRITLHAFHARYLQGTPQTLGCAAWRWVELAELDAYPFPVTDLKIMAVLRTAAPVPEPPASVPPAAA